MSERFLVGDGYTAEGRIPREAGVHPELEFTYRPALSEEVNAHFKRVAEEKRHKVDAALIVAHVTKWNIPGDVSLAIAERLQPVLSRKLLDVILGYATNGMEETDAKN
jgi:hypothetical protein